jgi:hypothetical protein
MWNRSALSIGALDVRYRDIYDTPRIGVSHATTILEKFRFSRSSAIDEVFFYYSLMKSSFITKATRQDVKEIGITFEQNQAHNFLLSIPTCVNLRHQGPNLFALLELARIAGRRKVTQIQIKLFKRVSVNCFSLQLR